MCGYWKQIWLIDRAGKYVIKPRFDSIITFDSGLAQVKVGDKWGIIDKTGKYIAKPMFDKLFMNPMA